MAWTDITWLFNEQPSSNKRNTEFQSVVHVREEANYWNICQFLALSTNEVSNSLIYRVEIDGSTIGTDITSTGESVKSDVSLAGVADGIHTLELTHAGSSFSGGAVKVRFYKSPDMDYLTWWLDVNTVTGSIGDYDHSFDYFNVIGHREIKSWT